jgi:hypothetical protein
MAITDPAFFIKTVGSWPNEVYQIAPSAQLINPSLGFLPAENLLRYQNNPINETDNLADFQYSNTNYYLNADTGQYNIDTNNNATIQWNVSSMRYKYNIGPQLNYFYINIDQSSSVRNYYAYLLYPYKLSLKPTGKPTKVGNNWSLTTTTVLVNPSSFFFYTSSPGAVGYDQHTKYLIDNPVTGPLGISSSNYSIVYNLCACRTRVDVPIVKFTNTYNPYFINTVLEPNGASIRPDSTFVSFNVKYLSTSKTVTTLGQDLPDETPGQHHGFKSSYILKYDPTVSNTQIFQLIQNKPKNDTRDLLDPNLCVLSATINLDTTNFRYFSNYYFVNNTTIINNITGTPGSYIGFRYIADCPTLQYTGETWQSTVVSFNNTGGAQLGKPINTNVSGYDSTTWTTKYPPHYYSFKASLSSSTQLPLLDTASLTFYLYSSAINTSLTTATLSTYIKSDFNFIKYDLWTYSQNDYIKFSPINTDSLLLSSIYCYYGNNQDIPYSLLTSPWIPASSANTFLVTYPGIPYGEIDLTLRPTLCSVAGYLDAYEAINLKMAQGYKQPNPGNPIFLNLLEEGQDYISVNSSFMISESAWPTRDLRDSYISWSVYPSGNTVSINAIDTTGAYITNIQPNSAVLFNTNTWSVMVSGYGPQTTFIYLSSQKYNETTSLTSNSALFDYFAENQFIVGPSIGLNNLNQTRTIQLTAVVPYKGRIYSVPSSTPIYWYWTYDDIDDASLQPIEASYKDYTNYDYGITDNASTLSALNLRITPPSVIQSPNVHSIKVFVVSYTKMPPISGSYQFYVDDFPSSSVFNTNFTTSYTSYPLTTISDNSSGRTVVTRPDNGTNLFTLSANTNSVPFLDPTSIVWVLSSTNGSSQTLSNSANPFSINLSSPATTNVSLCALNCIVPGWISAHNTQASAVFYIMSQNDFFNPLKIITFPSESWLQRTQYLTFLDQNNYTLFGASTAYANKKTSSQIFYLSANKSDFNEYIYTVGSKNLVTPLIDSNNYFDSADIPYRSELFSATGLKISLTAFNEKFTKENGLNYIAPVGSTLRTLYFNITSSTIPSQSAGLTGFNVNPKLVPYNDVSFSFNVNNSSLNLDFNRLISVTQTISTSPYFGPAFPTTNGTITYTLYTDSWSKNIIVPAVNGTINLPSLKIGDPFETGFVGNDSTVLHVKASASLVKQIPQTTFDNYTLFDYNGNRDLWTPVTQNISSYGSPVTIVAYITAINPEIYISSFYNLSGYDLSLQYKTPTNSSGYYITQYVTDFKEPNGVKYSLPEDTINYAYSSVGTFYISYSAIYNDGSIKTFDVSNPIIVKSSWVSYDQEDIRMLNETELLFPYNLNDILIQPNEWGDADIFNTAITRIQDNLDYLKSNSQTINTDSPTVYFGWLGCNRSNKYDGIRWYSREYGSDYFENANFAISSGNSYFTNLKSIAQSDSHIFVLDGTSIRVFTNDKNPQELLFPNIDELNKMLDNPVDISIDSTGTILFVLDSSKNRIYRFDLDLSSQPYINITLSVGGFGKITDPNKFNTPTQMSFGGDNLFVLDYNNRCVKEYNSYLNWIHTYNIDSFDIDRPVDVAAHDSSIVYVLTEKRDVYVFDNANNVPLKMFSVTETFGGGNVVEMFFDEPGEFLYIVTEKFIYKYSAIGYYISILTIPNNGLLSYTAANKSPARSLIFSTARGIIKVQDLVDIFRIGDGNAKQYWSTDQLKIQRKELAHDFNYNKSLTRMAQNLKTFRNSINAIFTLVTEQTNTGTVTYFSLQPLLKESRPVFDPYVEAEKLYIGVNELHIPQVINRELERLYNAVESLRITLNMSDLNIVNNSSSGTNTCQGVFCWSWSSMGSYNLTLPLIRICNVNPITYDELKTQFPVNYAPSKIWANATSECCNQYENPLP